MARKVTQRDKVLRYLREHGTATSFELILHCGAVDARRRIHELRELGYPIADRWDSAVDDWGDTITFKRYFLKKGA